VPYSITVKRLWLCQFGLEGEDVAAIREVFRLPLQAVVKARQDAGEFFQDVIREDDLDRALTPSPQDASGDARRIGVPDTRTFVSRTTRSVGNAQPFLRLLEAFGSVRSALNSARTSAATPLISAMPCSSATST
jgi:hypothetical protein